MKRRPQITLIVSFIAFSWLGMQVVHESGHVIVTRLTGGEVTRVALHPLIISRTDVAENPHPLAVVWGGPLLGSLIPLMLFGLATALRAPGLYLFRFFAGFCLVANGVYIGLGPFLADGADPLVMTENGSPRWLLAVFGLSATSLGLYLWPREGRHFGLGEGKGAVNAQAALVSLGLFLAITVTELVRNVR
jgi:hypothetical protein